jgi:predicted alpha/beta superfamily hydrolase
MTNVAQKHSNQDDYKFPKVCIEYIELHSFRSRFVDQGYQLQVYLPPSYSGSTKSFPVIYLFDSDKSSGMAKDIVEWLNWFQEIPEVIIVGIAYGEGTEQWWQKRSRDYTPWKDRTQKWGEWLLAGGGDTFLNFIAQELIPFVDSTFRTQGNDRALAGLSFGGLFAAYSLLTQPELFNRYFLIAPAFLWADKAIFKCEEAFFRSHDSLPAIVYSVIGDLDDREKLINPWQEFYSIVDSRNYKDFHITTEMVPGETHISVYPLGLTRGLKVVCSQG